ncbi:MAG TPA: molybdenum cofactor guanylyltransferase [Thermoanaerobaculia bacterium]|nr:molybdenum cofactor guanylyltransferase [Thermoanaerobaculia bacterium]
MTLPMPAAVLAGGASSRMGRPKAALAYGAGTLLEFQTRRLAETFEEVLVVVKEVPAFGVGPARVLLDRTAEAAAIHGLARALEEARDRVFVLAVDLPGMTPAVARRIAERSLSSDALAVVPRADGRLQPLAAVWRKAALPELERRVAEGKRSLRDLASAIGAEILEEEDWKDADPSGASFANLNTLEEWEAHRERA